MVVAGINKAKKHVKPANGQPGQIIEKEMSLHVSNVAIIDPDTKKPTRVGFKMEGNKKIRIAKKSGKTLAK